MDTVTRLFHRYSRRARARRAALFRESFVLDESTRVLDLGSGNGEHIHMILRPTRVRPGNVYIADIRADALEEGRRRFGYRPVHIDESGRLPFPDRHFDIVYCSSVIEHVTLPKSEVWRVRDGARFRRQAFERQARFAGEIRRLGRQYFVQTPHRHFPLESHSWLPLAGALPRRWLVPLLAFTNRFWFKKTAPDWNLLDRRELAALFPDAGILEERSFGLVKSLMAVRSLGRAASREPARRLAAGAR